ncbi:ciliary-associated calcium-binding coiled-coil protein 1-like [Dendronephthya gigantea]|uniref:ciliary-associated calcium-binding coiled-coil protein 1-like n=1 Tax=Dendronephthya gigantea TaxID=151771 RepID=UPI00106AD278|nr:ciliary-associated calcium-binding coiled-coil protein 1-like [Dendronephthya gigantea]
MADVNKKNSRSKERLQTKQFGFQQSEIENSEGNNTTSEEKVIQNLIWKDLTEEQIVSFIALTPPELESKLAENFALYNYRVCLKEGCLVDFYVSAFWFAKQARFTCEQISAFFSLVKILLENIRDKKMSITRNILEMKNYIGTCSNSKKTDRPSLFSVYQTKTISDYVTESLFQHYKLYQLLFSSQLTDEPSVKQKLLVEVPPMADVPFPPPLDEGLPEEMHSEHVLGLKQSTVNGEDLDIKEIHTANDKQDNEINEITNEACELTQEPLFSSLKPDEMKQVLKDVSDGILSEVKNSVQKKLKDRESTILTKMTKK